MQSQKSRIFSRKLRKEDLFAFLYFVFIYVFTYATAFGQYHPQASFANAGSTASVQHEAILSGSVQRLKSTKPGLHLLVNTPQGNFDAYLGSHLSPEIQKSLSNDTAVQVTGVVKTVYGKQTFLIRQLTVDGKTVTVRNDYDFPVNPRPAPRINASQKNLNGGAQ